MNTFKKKSVGFIETRSYTATILACDKMAKAAYISLHSIYRVGGTRTCIVIIGDLASCNAALDSISDITGLESTVIARPAKGVQETIEDYFLPSKPLYQSSKKAETEEEKAETEEELIKEKQTNHQNVVNKKPLEERQKESKKVSEKANSTEEKSARKNKKSVKKESKSQKNKK